MARFKYCGKVYHSAEEVAKAFVEDNKDNLNDALWAVWDDNADDKDNVFDPDGIEPPQFNEMRNDEQKFYKYILDYAIALFKERAEYWANDKYGWECFRCGVTIFSE